MAIYTLANLQTDIRGYTEVGSTVLSDTILENQIAQAKKQLNQYDMGSKYIKVVLVFKGWELVHCEEEK